MTTLRDAIVSAMRLAEDETDPAEQIVNAIYAQVGGGRKLFFLFNQNVRRTNIQLAELVSLLRIHSSVKGRKLDYIDVTEFSYVKALISASIAGIPDPFKRNFDQLADTIQSIVSTRILIESYYGSASVFLPPHIDVDIRLICGESGYIHSCGHLLLLRNATKATQEDIERALAEAVTLFPDGKFLLVPYCHEDFTHMDRGKSQFYQYGLDDVKLHISKAHVGASRLIDVLESAASYHDENFLLAPAGDYKDAVAKARLKFGKHPVNTVWVIADSEPVLGSRFPGERKFYGIYLQVFRNHNYYHLFDENKPGWASHTTLPHSLTGAMLNIARPWLRSDATIRIADPFGGSGTTFLECQKIPGIEVTCSDLAPIYKYVVEDNVRFFKSTSEDLRDIVSFITQVRNSSFADIIPLKRLRKDSLPLRIRSVMEVVKKWSEETDFNFLDVTPASLSDGMEKVGPVLPDRLTLYLLLKTFGRSQSEIVRGASDFEPAFRREADEFISSCNQYIDYVDGRTSGSSQIVGTEVAEGSYSRATIPGQPRESAADLFGTAGFEVMDVRHLPQDRYDLIITDPPYAFNTDEDVLEFSQFVPVMLTKLVEALKADGGQLVMACPAASFSGRPVLPFIRSDYVTRELIRIAAERGKRCVVPAIGLPSVMTTVRPPYYWVAEKTLRRRILHFWIERRPSASG